MIGKLFSDSAKNVIFGTRVEEIEPKPQCIELIKTVKVAGNFTGGTVHQLEIGTPLVYNTKMN